MKRLFEKYWIAGLDFCGAALNVFVAATIHTWFQVVNLAAAGFLVWLGFWSISFAKRQERERANREEEARIRHINDEFPWLGGE